jgi:hypothetical protein
MINKYKLNINPTLFGRTRCEKSFNFIWTIRCISNLRRVTPFYSLVELCFDRIADNIKCNILNSYIKVICSINNPFTTANDLPLNAAKILISFPLFWFTLSTQMVNAMFSHSVEVCLPVCSWGLIDRYFIRVERENFGNGPGLYGNLISYNGTSTFEGYVKQLFTKEFLYNSLAGTDFERLVAKHVSESGSVSYHVDPNLTKALDSRLLTFDNKVYSLEFLLAVSSFYGDFSSKFKVKVVTATKLPDRRINIEAGLHCIRNHDIEDCYIYHKSVDPKFHNQFFFNSFVILAKIFKMTYYAADNSSLNNIRPYGDGIPGNNELFIDLSSVRIEDVFKTLLSASVRTVAQNDGKHQSITPLKSLEVPFGGIRQFSSFANPSLRNLDGNRHVPVGSIYYTNPVISFGYSKVDFGDGRVLMINIV